MLLTNNLFFYN